MLLTVVADYGIGDLAFAEVRQRFAKLLPDAEVTGLPVPGVYARHNAVDTPALLPDGTPSELSVSRVLTARDQNVSPEVFTEGEAQIERDVREGGDR